MSLVGLSQQASEPLGLGGTPFEHAAKLVLRRCELALALDRIVQLHRHALPLSALSVRRLLLEVELIAQPRDRLLERRDRARAWSCTCRARGALKRAKLLRRLLLRVG